MLSCNLSLYKLLLVHFTINMSVKHLICAFSVLLLLIQLEDIDKENDNKLALWRRASIGLFESEG